MNIERLNIIAEWLEAGAPHKDGVDGFDMRDWKRYTDCGTMCCIAGTAYQFFGGEGKSFFIQAANLLELDYKTAERLFYALKGSPGEGVIDLATITPAWAARCIRKLIATGEVDWVGTQAA